MTRATLGRRAAKKPAIVVIGGASGIVDALATYLRHQEYTIIAALLPTEVLRLLTQRPIPLVVCDDSAPGMRNFSLMGEIKQCSPQTHVVLVVPSGSPEQERRARAAGADTYVPAPFAIRRLHALLDDVLA